MNNMNAVIMTGGSTQNLHEVYSLQTRAALAEAVNIIDEITEVSDWSAYHRQLNKADVIFSTWGMPSFTEAQIEDLLPSLKAVFYAAGTVQAFARPFLNRGVRIFSAAKANGVPVAEYTVGQILLSAKGAFRSMQLYKSKGPAFARSFSEQFPGNFNVKIGIVGAGAIGKKVIELLKSYRLDIWVFDPFLPPTEAEKMGVILCDLKTLFSECQVVSNHLANNAQTEGIFTYDLFSSMGETATFINTGRGAQVVEADLVCAFNEVETRTALLDVTNPEPCAEDHPFREMPNVFLTPHISGSMAEEKQRMGEYMLNALEDFIRGNSCEYEVTLDMLNTMA